MLLFQIAGTTGTGKTDVILSLKMKYDIHLVNCDSVQIYKDLNIASNKSLEPNTHHLINLNDFNTPYDVENFLKDLNEQLDISKTENSIPFVVGGTGLYFSRINAPAIYQTYRLFLVQDRIKLYEKLDKRCEQMVLNGMLLEIFDLKENGLTLSHILGRSIGCRDALLLFEKLTDDIEENIVLFYQFLDNFKTRTRNYARKQECWFKKHNFHWVNIDKYSVFDVIEQIINRKEIDLEKINEDSLKVNENAYKKMKTYKSKSILLNENLIKDIILKIMNKLK